MAQCHDDQIVLFRARDNVARDNAGTPHRDFEDKLVAMLPHGPKMPLTAMPHLYDLKADSQSFERLRLFAGRLVVISWLPSRSAYWILRKAGVTGTRAESTEDQSHDARPIWCLDLHQFKRPEDCAELIHQILSRSDALGPTAIPGQAAIEKINDTVSPRWYPVIDYDRCVNCLECLNFCLFGVFSLDDSEAVLVEQPDACRPGCPACARVCPAGAIMFPEHADPVISGTATADSIASQGNTFPLLPMIDSLDIVKSAQNAAATSLSISSSNESPKKEDCIPEAEGGDRLDELVDGLDAFDL